MRYYLWKITGRYPESGVKTIFEVVPARTLEEAVGKVFYKYILNHNTEIIINPEEAERVEYREFSVILRRKNT